MSKKKSQPYEKIPKQDIDEQSNLHDRQFQQKIRSIKLKHPDCIPVFYAKHKAAPKDLKEPTTPFILFKKDLKIEQAMFRLYQQIQTKDLYFFCVKTVKDKEKYCKIKPGPTIQQIYNQFGQDSFLVLVYGNGEMGMEGLKKIQKWMLIVVLICGSIWLGLYGYQFYLGYGAKEGQSNKGNSDWVEQAN